MSVITTEIEGSVAHIRLTRAITRNALTVEDWVQLRAAVEALSASAARVIVLDSTIEGTFCAGSDLKAMDAMSGQPALVADFRLQMRAAIDAVANVAIPTIANIQGDCFGAGVALALACDIRVAGANARFGITPAKLGISYPIEDIARLVRLVGVGQSSRFLLTADTISAAEAGRVGLIEILGQTVEAERIAAAVARNAPQSVAIMKQFIQSTDGPDATRSDAIFDQFFASEAFAEGLRAFREKRKPVFVDETRRS